MTGSSNAACTMSWRLPIFRSDGLTESRDGLHTASTTQDKRLGRVLGINLAMVIALLLVGLLAHSLGVLASGADYLGDALGTGLSLVALRMSRHEHGHFGATSYASLANSSFLLLVTVSVAIEAVHPPLPRRPRRRLHP
jgi:Co/Zn/Cd efflux system component